LDKRGFPEGEEKNSERTTAVLYPTGGTWVGGLNQRLRPYERLRKRKEIRALLRHRGVSGTYCILYARRNDRPTSRFAVIVGKVVGKAVVRNRAKRRIREAYRRLKTKLTDSADIIIRAKRTIAEATYGEIARDIAGLLKKANLLKELAPGRRNLPFPETKNGVDPGNETTRER